MNRYRVTTLMGLIFTGIGLALILTKEVFYKTDFGGTVIISGSILLATGLSSLAFVFLQTGFFSRKIYSPIDYENNISNELEELKLEIYRLKKMKGETNIDENEVNNTINAILNDKISEELITDTIDKKYKKEAIEELRLKRVYSLLESLSRRLFGEISRLSRSASLNLVIGSITTTLAIVALGVEVFFNEIDFTNSLDLVSHYVPRLSIVIFIEIFAFFFLKLYKSNLQDIKYFHNEKTNIDLKAIAIITSISSSNPDILKDTINELNKTERNYKLSKGESTVEIEKGKLSNNNNAIITDLLSKILSKVDK